MECIFVKCELYRYIQRQMKETVYTMTDERNAREKKKKYLPFPL